MTAPFASGTPRPSSASRRSADGLALDFRTPGLGPLCERFAPGSKLEVVGGSQSGALGKRAETGISSPIPCVRVSAERLQPLTQCGDVA